MDIVVKQNALGQKEPLLRCSFNPVHLISWLPGALLIIQLQEEWCICRYVRISKIFNALKSGALAFKDY